MSAQHRATWHAREDLGDQLLDRLAARAWEGGHASLLLVVPALLGAVGAAAALVRGYVVGGLVLAVLVLASVALLVVTARRRTPESSSAPSVSHPAGVEATHPPVIGARR